MLTQEQKNNWISALRSGKYKQAQWALRDRDGYCCLGVFCKEIEGIEPDIDQNNKAHYTRLDAILGKFDIFAEMNDGVGMREHSFSEIADYIEKNVPCAH